MFMPLMPISKSKGTLKSQRHYETGQKKKCQVAIRVLSRMQTLTWINSVYLHAPRTEVQSVCLAKSEAPSRGQPRHKQATNVAGIPNRIHPRLHREEARQRHMQRRLRQLRWCTRSNHTWRRESTGRHAGGLQKPSLLWFHRSLPKPGFAETGPGKVEHLAAQGSAIDNVHEYRHRTAFILRVKYYGFLVEEWWLLVRFETAVPFICCYMGTQSRGCNRRQAQSDPTC